jgi:hypothetical protein
MSGYIGNIPVPQATQTRDTFTATAGQTSFATSGYTPGYLDVFLNGVHLVNGTDYTATNGSDVVLTSGAALDDNLEVVAYTTFQVVDQSFSGNFSVDTDTLFVDATNNRVGVGTSSPQTRFEAFGGDARVALVSGSTTTLRGYQIASGTTEFASLKAEASLGETRLTSGFSGFGGFTTFHTNGSERLRIDSSGNVGIGTSAPSVPAEVSAQSDSAYLPASNVDANGLPSGTNLLIRNSSSTGNSFAGIGFLARSSRLNYIGTAAGNSANQPSLVFGARTSDTASAEFMRINASGNLLVGCTSLPSASVKGNAFLQDANQGRLYVAADNTGARDLAYWINPNGVVGTITTTGSATAYNTSSDYRLKEDVQPMVGSVDRLMALKPVNFAWKADGTRVDGFLAHEAQAVVPESVTGEKDQVQIVEIKDEDGNVTGTEEQPVYQGIDQSKIVPLLTAALQEALTKIEQLEARMAILEGGAA